MTIELSSITFTDEDDIVPLAGAQQIFNTGITNTLAGNDILRGSAHYLFDIPYAIYNTGTLNMGEGDDVLIGNVGSKAEGILIASGSTLDTGNGNDRIQGGSINNESFIFTTGDGDDTIDAMGDFNGLVNRGFIDTGNGKDTIIAIGGTYIGSYPTGFGLINYFTIDTGEGEDIINAEGGVVGSATESGGISNYGTIDTGDGGDTITGNSGPDASGTIINTGTIDTGEGDDIITASRYGLYSGSTSALTNTGTIDTGNGQDSISSGGIFTNRGEVFLGEGNDSLTCILLENFNAIDTGDGDDRITSDFIIYNEGVINTGNGNDSIIINSFGDVGTSTVVFKNFNVIETGEGNDIITSHGIIYNEGVINTSDGNDSIIAAGFGSGENSSGTLFLGEGEDYIKGFGSGDFYGGNDEDTLELTPGSYTVEMWDTKVIFTKGSSFMITSEFERLKAGNTFYDFTSFTEGQIITVA